MNRKAEMEIQKILKELDTIKRHPGKMEMHRKNNYASFTAKNQHLLVSGSSQSDQSQSLRK